MRQVIVNILGSLMYLTFLLAGMSLLLSCGSDSGTSTTTINGEEAQVGSTVEEKENRVSLWTDEQLEYEEAVCRAQAYYPATYAEEYAFCSCFFGEMSHRVEYEEFYANYSGSVKMLDEDGTLDSCAEKSGSAARKAKNKHLLQVDGRECLGLCQGMTKEGVQYIIGRPSNVKFNDDGTETWEYERFNYKDNMHNQCSSIFDCYILINEDGLLESISNIDSFFVDIDNFRS